MSDRITLRFLAAPSDTAVDGASIQAGRVLEWIDKAGYACAVGFSSSYCVTAYVGNVHFTRPILPGNLIEARARIIHTGRTSMHVLVTVDAADAREGVFAPATHCILIFVAIDENKKPREIPHWSPSNAEDAMLAAGATLRIEARAEIHAAMRAQEYTDAATTPRTLFRFLAAPGDANWAGNAHGGTVMRWIDEAAGTCAMSWSRERALAVYSGGIHFYRPIHIGHIVEVEARLIHTGPRSMHLGIHVRSGDPRTGILELTTQCMSVFVVPGEDGRAASIAPLDLQSAEDVRLDEHARQLVAMRRALKAMPVEALSA